MTDAELTEFASKAFGSNTEGFSPLTDDGDALRLAVKLGLSIDNDSGQCEVYGWSEHTDPIIESHHGDPLAATRRAIVRAAAAIGRMK